MPYHPDLAKTPITALALYDNQPVELLGWIMTFRRKPDSDLVFLIKGLSDPDAYAKAWDRYMAGVVGFTKSPPNYSDFYQHVRQGPLTEVHGKAEFTRDELVEVLTSGNYYIG